MTRIPKSPGMEDAQGEAYLHVQEVDATTLSQRPVIVAVMGVTGTGKSTIIQLATGRDDVIVGHDLEACTREVQEVITELDGRSITLVDTPGFNDTFKGDTEILKIVAQSLMVTYEQGYLITGIIYLHRINNPRMEGSSLRNLHMFRKLCGQDALKHVLLVTTHWNSAEKSAGEFERLEAQLKEKYWQELIDQGAEYFRFDGSKEEATELIRTAARKGDPVKLAIQREMVDEMLNLWQTGAGQQLYTRIAQMMKDQQKEIQELRREIQTAKHKEREQIKRDLRYQEKLLQELIATQESLLKDSHNTIVELKAKIKKLEDSQSGGCTIL